MYKNSQSIVEMNTLSHAMWGWQTRLDEIEAADSEGTRFFAWHHFFRSLDQEIPSIRFALATYKNFMGMPNAERKAVGTKEVRNVAEAVFRCFVIMDRLEPGIVAIEKLAGGDLPNDLRVLRQQIWRVLEKAATVQQKFHSAHSSDLSKEIGPMCDELQNHIVAFYVISRARYGLAELDCAAVKQ